MFGKKKLEVVDPIAVTSLEESKVFKSVPEIMGLFSSPIAVEEPDPHYEKLLQLKGRVLDLSILERRREKHRFLLNNNIKFKVTADIAKSFKYCGIVYQLRSSTYSNNPSIVDVDQGRSVLYDGDLPEFVIDRLFSIKEDAWERFGLGVVTIHSNEALSVKYEPISIDPVVILWDDNPNIQIKSGVVKYVSSSVNGYVIAVWNELGQEI